MVRAFNLTAVDIFFVGHMSATAIDNVWTSGSLDLAAKSMEVDIAKAGLHMLVEKPISMRPAEEVERLAQVSHHHA